MAKPPEITIVIVNYNAYKYTAQCLDSLFQHPSEATCEIVVVDNASVDGSDEALEAAYPAICVVHSPENRGIAGGNNIGIQAGSGRFVLLLNNDTIVLRGSIDLAVEFLKKHPDVGGVGGNLINPDGTFQAGACPFPSLAEEFLNVTKLGLLLRKSYPSYRPYNEHKIVNWMSTAFMLFRRDALEQVGLVDERFFIYSDETDLEYRLWQAGWKIYYLPEIQTIHFGGKSLEPWRARRLKYRGRLLFFRKHHTAIEEVLLRAMYALASSIKLGFWGIAYLMPKKRKRAINELQSQYEILKLSLLPILPPVSHSKS
jgi:hypothetical protein